MGRLDALLDGPNSTSLEISYLHWARGWSKQSYDPAPPPVNTSAYLDFTLYWAHYHICFQNIGLRSLTILVTVYYRNSQWAPETISWIYIQASQITCWANNIKSFKFSELPFTMLKTKKLSLLDGCESNMRYYIKVLSMGPDT